MSHRAADRAAAVLLAGVLTWGACERDAPSEPPAPAPARRGVATLDPPRSAPHARSEPSPSPSPDAAARARVSAWLSSPMEYGRAPDALELADSRVLYWPPTGDRRRLWVYRYRYGTEERYALTGSVTFSLVGTETLEPEQVYAFHCSWELRQQRDPRAPQVDSVAAGQAILDRYNAAEAFVEPASRASDSE